MASVAKVKKSKGKTKASKLKEDVESKIGSVISVKEADEEDKANSVPQHEEEKSKTEKVSSSEDEKGQADEKSSESHSASAVNSQPGTAEHPPSPSPSRPISAVMAPSGKNSTPGSQSPSLTRANTKAGSPELGSAVSLRSREAWSDRPGTALSKGRPSTASYKDNQDSLNKSLASLRQAEREINEHHAYVPYLYAKDCIARIVEDMNRMKTNHIRIVHDIEFNYKEIENESQSQFNNFVMSLRTQYANKVKTFRQVIEVHRIELDQKQQYWDEALASLSKRNKVLLLDKKSLLVQNRVEFERLEKEKVEAVKDLTHKLDEANSKLAVIYKENEENFDAERKKYEEEKKILWDQLETEKGENEKLRERIEELEAVGAVVVATTVSNTAEEKEVKDKNSKVKAYKKGQVATELLKREPTVVVTDMSEEERKRMEEERRQMEEERQRMREEREKMEQDRLKFEEDRKKFQEDRVVLQGDLTNAQKEAANWQGKYDALKDQLGELAALKANYDALKAQYDALAAMALVQSAEDKKKADEAIQKAQNDKDIMEEQKVMLEEDIKKWEEDFQKQNGRKPEEADKSEAVHEMETSLDEANNMINALEVKIDTVEKLKEGEVPKAPEVTAGPVVIPEPEVKIVEVKVPDPEIIAQLEMTQAELDALRKQVKALRDKTSGLQSDKSKLQGELAESSAEVNKLDATVKALEEELAKAQQAGAAVGATTAAAAVAATAAADGGVDPVEHARMKADLEKQLRETENDLNKQLENQENDYEERIRQLEKDKKAMERDIKKLIKAHQKLKAKMDAKDDHTKEIFPVVLAQVKEVHSQTPAAAEIVGDRLREAEAKKAKVKSEEEQAQKAYEAWEIGDRSNEQEGEKLKAELNEAKKNTKDLDHAIEALTMIKTGIVTKAKIDKTDAKPAAVEKEALLEEAADAEDKVAELEDNIADLEGDKQMLEDKNKRLEEKLAELERELEEAQNKAGELGVTAAAAAATGSAASQEDIEALKRRIKELEELLRQRDAELEKERKEKEELEKERAELAAKNKEMEKDIKKMIKAYQKLKDKLKALQEKSGKESAPDAEELEEKVTQLENQVIDLETDRDSLADTNKKQEDKIAKLEDELEEAKARSAELSGVAILAANSDDIEALKRANAELRALLEQAREQLEKETQQKQELEKKLETSEEERREMEKDMKKMIKAYNKLKDKLAALQPGQQPQDTAAELDRLEEKVTKLENKVIDLESDNKNLDMSNKEKEDKLGELQQELDEAREKMAELTGVAATAVPTEDVEALKRALADMENQLIQKEQQLDKAHQAIKEMEEKVAEKEEERREMEKDMKKLMKAHQKLKDKLAALQADPAAQDEVPKDLSKEDLEKKLSDLEDKVIELEADNKSLQDSKQDQEDKIQRLEEDLEQAKAAVPVMGVAAAALAGASSSSHLREEKQSHDMCREELEAMRKQVVALKADLDEARGETDAKVRGATSKMQAEIDNLTRALEASKSRVNELDKARLAKVPIDAQKEIKELHKKVDTAEKERDQALKNKAGLEGQVGELKAKIAALEKTTKSLRQEVAELQNKAKAGGRTAARPSTSGRADPKSDKALQVAQEKLQELRRENAELKQRIRELESEAKRNKGAAAGGEAIDPKVMKRHEKILKELEKKLEIETSKSAKNEENLKKKEAELKDANKEIRMKDEEIAKLKAELSSLGVAAKEGVEAAQKAKALEKEVKKLSEENKQLAENFNSERVLRKKYYNMVEDMKGKIRVYCRARPMSKSELGRGNISVVKSPDEYTCIVDTSRGPKEFQFDQVFMPEHSQEKVFEDTNNLIQTAVDGYNVCIFAYGQTGSGKTYTMIGDKEQASPGIAPRAFNKIFEVMQENKAKFRFKLTSYMLELYNDKLLDLYAKPGTSSDEKLEIKKDKKGMVFVQGAEIKAASNAKELFALFEEGSKNRHTASTKMNSDSSRSHLVLAIIIESTNKTSGQVLKGKLSLVDLAGSERAAKTEASAEQLKEAMSINKSLSALGDVISALSSEQSFIPYRNNKLTMLMQDSLGGNAKTLMFVNISPADYNTDESVVSLTYASRVKLITNDASKNADNKEIARLRAVIQKLKKGDKVEEGEDED